MVEDVFLCESEVDKVLQIIPIESILSIDG